MLATATIAVGAASPGPALISSAEAASPDKKTAVKPALRMPDGPALLLVSLQKQKITIYDRNGVIAESKISSGMRGRETPTGVFTILEKNRMHYSNLYGDAPMPFMQRITWSGVALHAGMLPGYPASHGCIRLPYNFAKQLFEITKSGARVIVAQDDYQPAEIVHAKLLKPLPAGDQAAALTSPAQGAAMAQTVPVQTAQNTPHSDVAMMLGVTPAAAEEAAPAGAKPARTRASVAAERALEMEQFADAITSAEATRAASLAEVGVTLRAANEAKKAFETVKAQGGKIEAAIAKARKDMAGEEAQLAELVRRSSRGGADISRMSDAHLEKAAEREMAQETKILDLQRKLDALNQEREQHSAALDAAETFVNEKDSLHLAADAKVRAAVDKLHTAQVSLAEAKKAFARRDRPVTVFVSLKSGKVQVRQNYEPVLEAAVTIASPEKPIGTHVFTALNYDEKLADLKWNVVSVPKAAKADTKTAGRKDGTRNAVSKVQPQPFPASEQTAAAALERIQFAPETIAQLEELVKPGSSLIISDNGPSNETGEFTDVIVSLR
jgi:hypothetical protein